MVLTVCGAVSATGNSTQCVSISSDGVLSDGYSCQPSISADGNYVAFSSGADNLVPGDTNGFADVFVRDLSSNTVELVSVSSDGSGANGDSGDPSISSDGRYVAFSSSASNLVQGDTNGCSDVFVFNRLTGATNIISISDASEIGNGDTTQPSISADGRYVAFTSFANNLVSDDNNNFNDVFVHDMVSGTTKLISVSVTGDKGNYDSSGPSISADGRFIAFSSCSNNLVPDDNNGFSDVFVYDQNSGMVKRVSVSSNGVEGNGDSFESSISGNGQYIAFTSSANNLVILDSSFRQDVFVYDQNTGKTERVSILTSGGEINIDSHEPSISSNGRYVAFILGSPSAGEPTAESYGQVFVHDRILGITKVASISNNGEDANASCFEPSVSADGHYVAFSSIAENLVDGDGNGCTDVFVHSIFEDEVQQVFSGSVSPDVVKSGDIITIKAYSNFATNVTAALFNETINLIKESENTWTYDYRVPDTPDGNYSIELTAKDTEGNFKSLSLNFTVHNTPPTVSGNITPNLVKSGDNITISASSGCDLADIWVSVGGENQKMSQNSDGIWTFSYSVPELVDGEYPVLLTAIAKSGSQGTATLHFTVDNTPPVVSGTITPDPAKTYDKITIKVSSDPDTASITVLIFNQVYSIFKQVDGAWGFDYTCLMVFMMFY